MALIVAALAFCATTAASGVKDAQRTAVNQFIVTIGGSTSMLAKWWSRPVVSAKVESAGQDKSGRVNRFPGAPRREPVTLQMNFNQSAELYRWVGGFCANTPETRDVGLTRADATRGQVIEQWSLGKSAIVETVFPGGDLQSEEEGFLLVRVAPTSIERVPADAASRPAATAFGKARIWQLNRFQFAIDGFESDDVIRVEPFSVKRRVVEAKTGPGAFVTQTPSGTLELPNLVVTITDDALTRWVEWHEQMVVHGQLDVERNGVLSMVSADGTTETARIRFEHLGILSIRDTDSRSGETRKGWQVELYFENMIFEVSAP